MKKVPSLHWNVFSVILRVCLICIVGIYEWAPLVPPHLRSQLCLSPVSKAELTCTVIFWVFNLSTIHYTAVSYNTGVIQPNMDYQCRLRDTCFQRYNKGHKEVLYSG